jgi:hypothetical protein
MAGVTGRTQMAAGINSWIDSLNAEMRADVQNTALEAAVVGLDAARTTIDTTPSSLSRFPKGNRNWTFEMNKALDSTVTMTGTKITIRVGWLNKKEAYFLIQEDGGQVRQKIVTPMHALLNADSAIRATLATKGIR